MHETFFKRQVIPLGMTVLACAVLIALLWGEIALLNRVTETDIALRVRWSDVLIGLTIYLKTSIDFAIYIGHLMGRNPGWKSRVAIEIGTAVGNAAGTLAILALWTFFKEVRWLLAIMILVAALVLFKLAEDNLEHAQADDRGYPRWFKSAVNTTERVLESFNRLVSPVLKYVVPHFSVKDGAGLTFRSLFVLSFGVPFVLGLDDFAGYVPLFSVVNVFGFAIGVFAGHMVLNALLYISPERTIRAVKHPVLSFVGSLAFVGLGLWGLVEVWKLLA